MLACASLISCNSSTLPPRIPSVKTQNCGQRLFLNHKISRFISNSTTQRHKASVLVFKKKGLNHICQSSLNGKNSEDQVEDSLENSGEGRDWTTSILLCVLWGALMYYVFNLAPNQTPSRDQYFLEKLLNLKGDDGFRMNQVLVSLWYIMGLWPLLYTMLVIPTGRSSKPKIPAWPFLILSCFGGAYVLLPYFVIWGPPAPPLEETELTRWPLSVMESKLTAWISLAAGIGLVSYAGLAGGSDWIGFYQYFKESRLVHVTCLDFTLLSAFAPFWVYNDMSTRNWSDKGSWLLPLSVIPFLGPALYVCLRPSLLEAPDSLTQKPEQQ